MNRLHSLLIWYCVVFYSFSDYVVNGKISEEQCEQLFIQQNEQYRSCSNITSSSNETTNKNLESKRKKRQTVDDVCNCKNIKINCIETAQIITKDCYNDSEKFRFTNQIEGLKAQINFECANLGINLLRLNTKPEILKCKKDRSEQIDTCELATGVTENKFLPPFELVQLHQLSLWTDQDCQNKANWMKCIISALDTCVDKSSKNYYYDLYHDVIDAYPACVRVFDDLYLAPGEIDYWNGEPSSAAKLDSFNKYIQIVCLMIYFMLKSK